MYSIISVRMYVNMIDKVCSGILALFLPTYGRFECVDARIRRKSTIILRYTLYKLVFMFEQFSLIGALLAVTKAVCEASELFDVHQRYNLHQ